MSQNQSRPILDKETPLMWKRFWNRFSLCLIQFIVRIDWLMISLLLVFFSCFLNIFWLKCIASTPVFKHLVYFLLLMGKSPKLVGMANFPLLTIHLNSTTTQFPGIIPKLCGSSITYASIRDSDSFCSSPESVDWFLKVFEMNLTRFE